MKTKFVFFLLLYAWCSSAQDKFFLNSYNQINCLKVQEDRLWVGTTKGLVLRDKHTGEICGIFNASNSPIPTHDVYDLEIGPDGALWIATHENVVRFDGESFEVQFQGLTTEIAFDPDGHLMTGTRFYTNICSHNYNLASLEIADGYVSNVVSNAAGYNYFANSIIDCFGTASGGSACWQEFSNIQSVVSGDTINIAEYYFQPGPKGHLNIDSSGNLYVLLDRSAELAVFDRDNQFFEYHQFDTVVSYPSGTVIHDSAFDPFGNFWMVGNRGVIKFDGASFTLHNEGLILSVSNNAIEIDEEGNMYVGANVGGIHKYTNGQWSEFWVDGLLSNSISNISSNTSGKKAFDSSLGLSIFEQGNFESFHPGNSIISKGRSYVDESGRVFLQPENNSDTLYFYDGTDWGIQDAANSNLLFYDFEFVYSDTSGNVWIKNNEESAIYKTAHFNNGIWSNYETLDALYQNTPLYPDPWFIAGTSAFFIENNDTTAYPIPDSLISTDCILKSVINEQGIGLAAVFSGLCDDFSWSYYDLLYFDGSQWIKIAEPDGQWNITEMGFRGDEIYFNEEPEFYQCGQARLKFVSPNLQIEELIFPLPDTIIPAGNNPVKRDFIDVVEGTDNELWVRYYNVYGFECHGYYEEYMNNRIQIFRLDSLNQITRYEAGHCTSFEDGIANLYKDRQGFVWNRGLNSIYTVDPIAPILETYTCGTICTNSMVSAVTIGGVEPFSYEWSNGQQSPFVFNSDGGSFSISVQDSLGQMDANSFEISEITQIDLSLSVKESDSMEQIIISAAEGGSLPYTYLWSDGSIDSVLLNPVSGNYSLTITDADGCTSIAMITVDEVTSSDELKEEGSYEVFPNPANEMITIECENCTEVNIISAVGKTMYHFNIENAARYQISTAAFAEGIYFVQFRRSEKIIGLEKLVLLR